MVIIISALKIFNSVDTDVSLLDCLHFRLYQIGWGRIQMSRSLSKPDEQAKIIQTNSVNRSNYFEYHFIYWSYSTGYPPSFHKEYFSVCALCNAEH